jgi:hypothetical protein
LKRGFVQTSPPTPEYNCIAFTLGDLSRWWWPPVYEEMLDSFWPAGAPAQETLEAFVAMYQLFGFELCQSADLEPEYIKIALFAEATESLPAHAALQLPSGRWASKMWSEEDLMHYLDSLEGPPNHSSGCRRALRPPIDSSSIS